METNDYDICAMDKQIKKRFLFIVATIIIIFALLTMTGFYYFFFNPHDPNLEIEANSSLVMVKLKLFKGLRFWGYSGDNYTIQIEDEYGNILWSQNKTIDVLYSVRHIWIYWSYMEPRPEIFQELIVRVWHGAGPAHTSYAQAQFTRPA